MFTGLIQHCGQITSIAPNDAGSGISIDTGPWEYVPDLGASVSVNGCCLSVVEVKGDILRFDVVHRSLEMTTLGTLKAGDRVNLEHAARADSLLGGHIVQGHVDGVGKVMSVQDGDDWRVSVHAPDGVAEHLCDRGSIAIDGVSLTVARVENSTFEVALIPITLKETNLGDLCVGSAVNLEADVMAKMVAQHVERILARR